VFVEVRYAHRHDAPGCAHSEDERVEITEDSISLSVLCLEATSKIRYKFNIQLYDKINITESTHAYQTVGRH
jgi:hypothetical protein